MFELPADDPLAVQATRAVQEGDLAALAALLEAHPGLAAARIGDPAGTSGTLLHALTDWPGHRPNAAETVRLLVEAGADPNARFTGPHTETPLHWAASSDDVAALDALLDAGADIEAGGAVIAGGTALADATAFAQWNAARRLVERGARSTLFESAALGLLDRLEARLAADPAPSRDELDGAFWGACHGGQLAAARRLHAAGADHARAAPWDGTTPLAAARRSEAGDLVDWLASLGARGG
jgi:hypothetical protein